MPLKEDVSNLLVFWSNHSLANALNPKKERKNVQQMFKYVATCSLKWFSFKTC